MIIGLCTEGSTDKRFLEDIIFRTFLKITQEAKGQLELLSIKFLEKEKGAFEQAVNNYAITAHDLGISILCIHVDADASSDKQVFENRISPAFKKIIDSEEEGICKNLVAIVPIYMTEAWMLADKELLKAAIGTSKNNKELGIHRSPESIANPKKVIEDAIVIARKDIGKRRRKNLTIAKLYEPIGEDIALEKLEQLSAYKKFQNSIRELFQNLNYL